MKTVTETIRNYTENQTPFQHIEVGDSHTIKLYWTKKGTMGYQCIALLFDNVSKPLYCKTSGMGYDKSSNALSQCFHHIGKAPKGMVAGYKKDFEPEMDRRYWIGGNYYRVAKSNLRAVK